MIASMLALAPRTHAWAEQLARRRWRTGVKWRTHALDWAARALLALLLLLPLHTMIALGFKWATGYPYFLFWHGPSSSSS